MAFNKVILVGNLTADPELRKTPNGVSVATFAVAVQRRYAKPEDPVQADFINIVAWRATAEFVSHYFTKGSPILVCGAIQTRNYTDQNGQKRYITEVVADEVSFVGRKGDGNGAKRDDVYYGEEPRHMGSAPAAGNTEGAFEVVGSEDDLPF